MATIRKAYAADGQRTQKHMAFRIDLDLLDRLNQQPNKGRFINEAIRKALDAEEPGK